MERYLDKLIPEPKFIVVLPDFQAIIIRRISKHSLIKALPEKFKSTFKDIIKQNHLSVRNENDLAKLVGLVEQ